MIKKPFSKSTKIILIALGTLLAIEIIARLAVPPDYHPFGMPLPTEASSGNHLDLLVEKAEAQKNPDLFRILVTGGSAAFGLGASDPQKSFPAQLDVLLKKKYPVQNLSAKKPFAKRVSGGSSPIQKTEVLNAAVESFDASSELLLYLKFLRKLKPDMVIMFTGFNDLSYALLSSLSRTPYKHIQDLKKIRYISPLDTGQILLVLIKSLFANIHALMARACRLYQISANVMGNLDFVPAKGPKSYRQEKAVQELEKFLSVVSAFQSVSQTEGFQLVVMLQPIRSCWGKNKSTPMSWSDVQVRNLYQNFLSPSLTQLTHDQGICYLDLNKAFVDRLLDEKGFNDTVHLNDRGYQLTAENVAGFIQRKIEELP